MFRYTSLLLTACAMLSLSGCGGSSTNSASSSTEAPSSLFPAGIKTGRLVVSADDEFTLTITFPTNDFRLGANYKGSLTLSTTNENDEESDTTPAAPQSLSVSGSLSQTDESVPGHVVLFFESTMGPSLYGVLRLELPASGAHNSERTRTGLIEAPADLRYISDKGVSTLLHLTGKEATITW